MNINAKTIIATLLAAGSCLAISAGQAAPPALHVSGNHLADPTGDTIVLRGANIPGCEYSYTGDHISTSPGVLLNTWKGTVIRLPMSEDFWFGWNGTTQQGDGGASYKAMIDGVVNAASAAGDYVILDCHWGDAGQAWGSNQGQHPGPDDHTTTFWTDMANHYKNNPAVIFDLWNEPHDTAWSVWQNGGTITDGSINYHSPGHQPLLTAIRNAGANNVVMAEGEAWGSDLTGIGGVALSDPQNNTMYEVHLYPCTGSAASSWDPHIGTLANSYPILVGEWGDDPNGGGSTCVPSPDPSTYTQTFLSWLDQRNYNWTAWSFNTSTTPEMLADWNYTPNTYFGQYVFNYLTSHNAPASNAPDINAGGPAVGSFAADANFSGGQTANNYTGAIDTSAVTNPAPQAVYQAERYGNITYTMQGFTANASYTVRLHFCENYWSAVGQRKFNVTIRGTQVLTNFDVFATAGAQHKAVIQQFNTTADGSGKIPVTFTTVVDNGLIDGIEVVAAGSPPAAPAGLSATAGNAQVSLSWSASTGATAYDVKRSTVSGSGYATVSSPTTTSYTNTGLTNGTTYYFVVDAKNANGTSANSSQASATPAAAGESAYNGSCGAAAWAIPGTIQAENYDCGGEGVAYHDTDTPNSGGQYRADGVDIEASTDTGGGYNVGWTAAGEYLKYTVNVATTGSYNIGFRVAAATATGTFHLADTNGTNLTGTVTAPVTGGWQTWTTVTVNNITLSAGSHTLQFYEESGNFNINWISFTASGSSSVQINAGGPAAGSFIADADFSGGTVATNNTGAVDTSAVTNPAPTAVYQSERYGAMTYTIPGFAANSSHTVRLHFTEDYFTTSGSRTFNVSINGTSELTNFDIFATAGAIHKANIKQFTLNANASGQYVIVFTNVVNNAKVDGIEVI